MKPKQPAYSPRRRTVRTAERNISVSLEDAFWNALKEIAVSKIHPAKSSLRIIDRRDAVIPTCHRQSGSSARLLLRPLMSKPKRMTLGNMRELGVHAAYRVVPE